MDEDEIAARLHGYYTSDSESSDNSDSDEELLNALRPPPIPLELEPENIVRVEAFKTVSYKKHKTKIPDINNKTTNSSFVNKSDRKNKTKANRNKKNANCKNTKDKKDLNIATKCQQNKKPQLSPINSENSYADIVKLEIKDEAALKKDDLAKSPVYCKNSEMKRAARKKKRKKENATTPYQINKPKTSDIASNVSSGSNLDLSNKSKLKKKVHFDDNKNFLEKDMLSCTSKGNGKISNVNGKEGRKTLIQEQKKVTCVVQKYQQKQITEEKRPLQACDTSAQEASNDNVNEKIMLQNKKKVVPLEYKMHNSGDHNSIEITRKAKKGKKEKGTNVPNDVLSSLHNPKNDTKEMELQIKKVAVVEEDKIHVLQERKGRMCDASTQTEIMPSSSSTSTRSAVENNFVLSNSQILEVTASDDIGNQKNGINPNRKKKKKKIPQSASYRSNLQENMMSADIKSHNTGDKKKSKKQSNSNSNTVHLQENETVKQEEKGNILNKALV